MAKKVYLTFIATLCLMVTSVTAEEKHWSLQPMKRAAVPVKGNPIDYFIGRKLRDQDLKPSPEADRVTLIRRVTLDLTGLPPSPQTVKAFLKDPRNTELVFAEAVDELLASPRYGERWAQHWLDVIRWAETVGFETNIERPNAWHYRDWVIAALNADMPYDRFILEQIAGDTVQADAALGFLVAGPALQSGQIGRDEEAMRSARQDELDEVIRTVGQGFLGLTIGCARCHDHKFDPINQNDYYSMQAIFSGLKYGQRRLRGTENDDWNTKLPAQRARVEGLKFDLEKLRLKHQLRAPLTSVHSETFEPILAQSIRMKIAASANGRAASLYEFQVWTAEDRNVALASTGAIPSASSFALANQTRHFENLTDGTIDRRQAFPWVSAKPGPAWIRIDFPEPVRLNRITWHNGSSVPADYVIEILNPNKEWKTVAHTEDRLPRTDDTRTPDQVKLKGMDIGQIKNLVAHIGQLRAAINELNRLSRGPQTFAANFTTPESTWLLRRGDSMQRLKKVAPAIPVALGEIHIKDHTEPARRLALARHLTQPNHPLTSRVITNRVWQKHFGTGLVYTPSDFGSMGEQPSHPELLDWLATEFIKQGWSFKKLHRLIVNSHTYRQASQPQSAALRVDADSRLLWRFPPRRLEAEAVRDCILSVSGKLNLKMGGRGFDFFNQRGGLSDYHPKETFNEDGWRRMIYAHKIRMQAVDIFGAFDCPDAGQMKPRRTRSITPVQSLSLLNSPFTNRQASFFAARVKNEAGDELRKQIDHAFRLATSRTPTTDEQTAMHALAQQHGLEQVCRVLFNTSEFLYLR